MLSVRPKGEISVKVYHNMLRFVIIRELNITGTDRDWIMLNGMFLYSIVTRTNIRSNNLSLFCSDDYPDREELTL